MRNRASTVGITVAIALSLVAGCGGSAGSPAGATAGACGFATPPPNVKRPAPPMSASVQAQAEHAGLVALDAYLGPYLRGETAVYRGTFSAHDNQGVLKTYPVGGTKPLGSQSVPMSSAVAGLVVTKSSATLTVHSLPTHQYVVFEQPRSNSGPAATSIGVVLSDDSAGGNWSTCTGCVPDLFSRPGTLAFDASGTETVNIGPGKNRTLHTAGQASLDLVPPCEVGFADLEELNAPSALAFHANDAGEMVAELPGYGFTPSYCYERYSIELYVNLSNLADYGVRSFVVAPGQGCGG